VVSDEQNLPPGSAVPTSAPASAAPASPASAAAAPRRGRRTLLVVVIAVAFLAVLGGTIGVVAYDKATAIDRSTPGVVTQQFMQAALIDRDPARVSLFLCSNWSVSDAMAATAPASQPDIRVNWGITEQSRDGNHATADLRVRLSASAGGGLSYREVQPWHITLVNEGSWRVCGLSIGPSINE
jgi:hypothetical protein